MRLLYLAGIRFPMERANGIQTVQTCHALARAGVDVDLVVRRSDRRSNDQCLGFFDLPPHPKLRLRRVRLPGRLGFATSALVRSLGRADVVFTRDLLLADALLRIPFTRVVYEAHTVASVFAEERGRLYEDAPEPSKAKLARLDARERRVFRGASAVVAITEALIDSLQRRHGKPRRGVVIPDGSSVPETMPPPTDKNRVYYIGQLYPWKGVDVLVEAMQYVPAADLVVVGGLRGEPDLDRVQSLANELGLRDRVQFRGFVPPTELELERRDATVFVVPNLDSTTARYYTSPLKLFEAMAAGRAVVASDLPSIREVLTHEKNALLVPPGDPRAMASAILRLLTDRELSERLARQAFTDVHEYSWDRRAAKIRDLMRAIGRRR